MKLSGIDSVIEIPIQKEDQTCEWKILDTHLQTLLAIVIRPLEHKREADIAEVVRRNVRKFCM